MLKCSKTFGGTANKHYICSMSKCQDKSPKIECVYFINPKDCIFDEYGSIIRMKRKYGKFNRKIYKYDYER